MARELIFQAGVKIVGITPLLMHKCGTIEKKASNPTTDYSEEWVSTVYLDQEQKSVAIPSMNLEAMMRDAATSHKIGKNALNKIVVTGILINEFEIPVMGPCGKPVTIDKIRDGNWLFSCAAVVQRNRITRTRACLPPGWNMTFNLSIYNPLLKPDLVEDLLSRGGYECGLCDWRPSKKGKFGQFEVERFDIA